MVPVNSLFENILRFAAKHTLGKRTEDQATLGCILGIIVATLTNIILGAVLWETLNSFYDVSPSGQQWLQSHLYPFWTQNIRTFASSPPSAFFLGMPLVLPNISLAPILVGVTGFVSFAFGIAKLETQKEVLEEVNPDAAADVQERLNFLSDHFGDVVGKPLAREAAILAFIPLGVSLYFVADKAIELYDSALQYWDTIAAHKAYKTRSSYEAPSKMFRRMVRVSLTLVVFAWLFVTYKEPIGNTLRAWLEQFETVVDATQPTVVPTTPFPPEPPTAVSMPTIPMPNLAENFGTATGDRLRVRSGPGTTFAILDRLSIGDRVRLEGRNNDCTWLKVQYSDRSGWVSAEFISANVDI